MRRAENQCIRRRHGFVRTTGRQKTASSSASSLVGDGKFSVRAERKGKKRELRSDLMRSRHGGKIFLLRRVVSALLYYSTR
jgi:hypothetical protein